jgi:cysteine desulfurase
MKRIFLDYAAITPVDSLVAGEMEKVQRNFWANPSSLHKEGEEAKNILEEARIKIARILHCRGSEVFFTSSGTESLNLAILGVVRSQRAFIPHIICSSIEHPAVLEPIKYLLKNKEAEVSFIVPNKRGIISPESIKKEIKENTALIIIQHANNEIGTIQPIRNIAEVIRDLTSLPPPLVKGRGLGERTSRPYLLVDASQSILYENVSLERLGANLLVIDGIKIYGPRGMGILAVKHNIKISPVIFGGGQESGLRSGTENTAGAVGLAKALEITVKKRQKESKRLKILRDYAIQKILKEIPNSSLNGDLENRLPNNINVCFSSQNFSPQGSSLKNFAPKDDPLRNFDSEFLVIKLDTLGFAVSAASACHTLSLKNSSYVIESLGKPECVSSSLRITLGRDTKKSDLDSLILALKKIIK